MLRRAALSLRMDRFEVFVAAVAMLLMAISAYVVRDHLAGIHVPELCWQQANEGTGSATCQALYNAWYAVSDNEAGLLLGDVAMALPLLVGLLLGVPIVAREIEMRTTALAWSLTGDRRRWLIQRALPAFLLLVGGLTVAGHLLEQLRALTFSRLYYPELSHLGRQGPTMIGFGIMAFGIALLVGALVGRTLPGLVVATALSVGLFGAGSIVFQGVLAGPYSVWVERDESGANEVGRLLLLDSGWRGLDGRFLDYYEMEGLLVANGFADWGDAGELWIDANGIQRVDRIVPLSAFPAFERAETAASVGIGLVAIVLTFVVVGRRRPT